MLAESSEVRSTISSSALSEVSMMSRFLRWLYGLSSKSRRSRSTRIEVRRDAFVVLRDREVLVEVPFSRVARVSAFKRDLGTVDLICFEIEVKGNEPLEVNEEMAGFEDLIARFTQDPKFDKHWRERVVKPAFATNRTTILST